MENVGANIVVRGTVQGVGFRYYVFHKATELRLKGFVRNSPDGTVEIEVEGDRPVLEEFIKRMKLGSSSSRVTDIKTQWKEFKNQYHSFDVR